MELDETLHTRWRRAMLVALAMLPGCVPIGCDIPGLIWPQSSIQVVDEEGVGYARAKVTVARFQVEPFFKAEPKNTREAKPTDLGSFVSAHEIGADTIYPMMLDGVGIHEWYACAEAEGRATRIVYMNTENEAVGDIVWGEVHGGQALPEVEVTLEPGESVPCSEALRELARPEPEARVLGEVVAAQ